MECKSEEEKDYTKYAAIFISLVALITSCYLGYKSHEHNKLSVSPYLDITYLFGGEGLNSGIRVDNPGLGPAIVESMSVIWVSGSEKIEGSDWKHVYEGLGVTNPVSQAKIATFKYGNALKSGRDELVMLGLEYGSDESAALERSIKDGIIDVVLCYRSLYGEYKLSSLQGNVRAVSGC